MSPLFMAVFIKNGFAFGFADLLNDDLLCGLRGNAAETGIVDLLAVEGHRDAEGLGIDLDVKGVPLFPGNLCGRRRSGHDGARPGGPLW